jgi:hypothetical protein
MDFQELFFVFDQEYAIIFKPVVALLLLSIVNHWFAGKATLHMYARSPLNGASAARILMGVDRPIRARTEMPHGAQQNQREMPVAA